MCSLCGEIFSNLRYNGVTGYWLCGGCNRAVEKEYKEIETVYCATEGFDAAE